MVTDRMESLYYLLIASGVIHATAAAGGSSPKWSPSSLKFCFFSFLFFADCCCLGSSVSKRTELDPADRQADGLLQLCFDNDTFSMLSQQPARKPVQMGNAADNDAPCRRLALSASMGCERKILPVGVVNKPLI